jgi:hypothetical protein
MQISRAKQPDSAIPKIITLQQNDDGDDKYDEGRLKRTDDGRQYAPCKLEWCLGWLAHLDGKRHRRLGAGG